MLYRRALTITENALGAMHPEYSVGLDNLAELLSKEVRIYVFHWTSCLFHF